MTTMFRVGFNPMRPARPLQASAPRFGVISKFRDVTPSFEQAGRTTSGQTVQLLRKNATGDPLVRIIKSQKSLDALTAQLGFAIPVDFKTQGVLVVSKENGNKMSLNYMNSEGTDPTNKLNVKLDTHQWTGVHTSLVSFSYYIAVVPKNRLIVKPNVKF